MPNPRTADWTALAAALANEIPRQRLHPTVLAWVDSQRRSRTPWYVAFSGGSDSLALLLLLSAHGLGRTGRLRALHFDHGLRGAASHADAEFCRRVCGVLKIPLRVQVWRRPRNAATPSEAEARTARHAFFAAHARVLWLGHHQDDVAETMLMRLARGSGTGGLSAPRPVQRMSGGRTLLRPLLTLSKEQLETALRQVGAVWCSDHTNAEPTYFRNRIRHDVLPRWVAAAQRDAVAGAALSRERLAEDDDALEWWVDDLALFTRHGALRLGPLSGKPRALVRRALHRWLLRAPVPVDLSRQGFESLLLAVERGTTTLHSLGRELFADIRNGQLQFSNGIRRRKFKRRVN